ncbi:MAG: formylmethanofuran dehydrogenase subunit A, partial [Hyphomicrobiaceae bacterium]|nr:formylmethanofuran dehydrogenase subunit A [Hyphomicrobiaceae bacterium]
MLIKLKGGRVYDPANGVDGEVRDIYVRDGRIVAADQSAKVDAEYDVTGRVVMAGAIDPHTHIGGGKMTIARMMLPEDHRGDEIHRTALTRSATGFAVPSTLAAGYRYAEMGYTAGFEPAMLPANARQAHMEMGDTPMIDKGAFVMLGSDDFLLRQMAARQDFEAIKDYIAWTMHAAQAIAVKVVNPGGISAFKFNQRKLDLDESHAHYGVTPRDVLRTLSRGLKELGVTHPLHVHGCNLGVPGNVSTTLDTIRAMEGLPVHLTHIQFHSYGTEGDQKFSSGAAQVAELINQHANISIDVGQIL